MRLRDWILICLHNDPKLCEIDYIRLIFYDEEDIIMRFHFSKIDVIHFMNMLGNELIPRQRKLLCEIQVMLTVSSTHVGFKSSSGGINFQFI